MKAIGITNGAQLLLMGTAAGQELKKPEQPIKFVEDMTPEERARILHDKTGVTLPSGLENLGNTCYMNATVQCLKRVNELKDGLKNYQDSSMQGGYDAGKKINGRKRHAMVDTDGRPLVESVSAKTTASLVAPFPKSRIRDQELKALG